MLGRHTQSAATAPAVNITLDFASKIDLKLI